MNKRTKRQEEAERKKRKEENEKKSLVVQKVNLHVMNAWEGKLVHTLYSPALGEVAAWPNLPCFSIIRLFVGMSWKADHESKDPEEDVSKTKKDVNNFWRGRSEKQVVA